MLYFDMLLRKEIGSVKATLCCAKRSRKKIELMILLCVAWQQIFQKCAHLDHKISPFSRVHSILASVSDLLMQLSQFTWDYKFFMLSFPEHCPAFSLLAVVVNVHLTEVRLLLRLYCTHSLTSWFIPVYL